MSKFIIEDHLGKIGDILIQSGMTLSKRGISVEGSIALEGPCDIEFGKLYIWPLGWKRAVLINVGDDVEVVSQKRDLDELQRRKDAVIYDNLSWQDQIGEENTRMFDPSHEGW